MWPRVTGRMPSRCARSKKIVLTPDRWNQTKVNALFRMIDPIEDVLAPAVIECALIIFGSFKDRARVDLAQARKALTPRVFDLISSGQTGEKQLVVLALTYLKSLVQG
jgi:hypothetical protein